MASQDKLVGLVKPSVDFLCQLKFPSGNYPPCIGDTRDLLVHWCHGAPGVIYMLIQAYKVNPKHDEPLYENKKSFINNERSGVCVGWGGSGCSDKLKHFLFA